MNAQHALIVAAQASPSAWGYIATRGELRIPRHIELLDRKLRALARREIRGLIVETPPRHGKTELGTKAFPGWYLGTHPQHRVMLTAYGAELASGFGRRVRDDLTTYGEAVFGVKVNPASSAANRWDLLDHTGGVVTAGVGGSLTGMGADLLIIDDPVKNQDEAQSETYRTRTWEWWTSTARTRLHPDGVVLVIQTRWHEDDLAGRLQRDLPPDWEVVRLPALAESDDPLGRAVGEALWPERYDAEALEQIRTAVGSYVWSALYQQRPAASDGGLVRSSWWRTYDEPPRLLADRIEFDEVVASWDLAFKDSRSADYVVGQVWGRAGGEFYLLHQVRDRMDFPATRRAIQQLAAEWPQARVKLVEDKANGPAVIADLKHDVEGLVAVNPQGGKIARLVAVSHLIEAGAVYLPEARHAAWVDAFRHELAAFPNGVHDDQVDAMSQALLRLKRDERPATASNPLDVSDTALRVRDAAGRRRRLAT